MLFRIVCTEKHANPIVSEYTGIEEIEMYMFTGALTVKYGEKIFNDNPFNLITGFSMEVDTPDWVYTIERTE